ncbi:hypothetical protein D0Z08_03570 [Nocardioides immobilis]|uniref:WD40 repeat domain-containing protein n=1 Tax=Nocardioides immobilis TaxID=2049295 RepID=A0A417Y8Z5_9ACTN|nr:hypothetical protein [Nocardioides immobilis]RHW28924.1 hypothetical protein D0Z08_03570 [Nocardioides immobilis]
MNKNPNDPTSSDAPWEEAMSRDFDARVRDLHEAPLDFNSVKGKARTIRRNRRAAVAGGILGVAAIVTPIAVLTNGGDTTNSKEPDFAPPGGSETSTSASRIPGDYVLGGVWHQADGDTVDLPNDFYDPAVLWNGQLVGYYATSETEAAIDVIDDEGTIVETIPVVSAPVVNETGETLAYIEPGGDLVSVAPDGTQQVLHTGLTPDRGTYSVAAISGGPDCSSDECRYLVNDSGVAGGCSDAQSSDTVVGSLDGAPASKCFDVDLGQRLYSVIDEVKDDLTACGGVFDAALPTFGYAWRNCDFQPQQFSLDAQYVAAIPSQGDSAGPLSLSILDARTGVETAGRFAPEGGHIGTWAWTDDNKLLFDTWDGAQWHLMTLAPSGEVEEIADPIANNDDVSSPFTIVGAP